MKVALYIEEGLEQMVLTPENDTEVMVLAKLEDSSRTIEIKHGSFYECRGGWTRHAPSFTDHVYGGGRQNDKSTMIVLRAKEVETPTLTPAAPGFVDVHHMDHGDFMVDDAGAVTELKP